MITSTEVLRFLSMVNSFSWRILYPSKWPLVFTHVNILCWIDAIFFFILFNQTRSYSVLSFFVSHINWCRIPLHFCVLDTTCVLLKAVSLKKDIESEISFSKARIVLNPPSKLSSGTSSGSKHFLTVSWSFRVSSEASLTEPTYSKIRQISSGEFLVSPLAFFIALQPILI